MMFAIVRTSATKKIANSMNESEIQCDLCGEAAWHLSECDRCGFELCGACAADHHLECSDEEEIET